MENKLIPDWPPRLFWLLGRLLAFVYSVLQKPVGVSVHYSSGTPGPGVPNAIKAHLSPD